MTKDSRVTSRAQAEDTVYSPFSQPMRLVTRDSFIDLLTYCKIVCDFNYSSLWDLSEYCFKKQLEFKERGLQDRHSVVPTLLEPEIKKRKTGGETAADDVVEMQCAFLRSLYSSDVDLPKTRLLAWTRARGLKHPAYATQQEDKLFKSVVVVDGKKYSSSYW